MKSRCSGERAVPAKAPELVPRRIGFEAEQKLAEPVAEAPEDVPVAEEPAAAPGRPGRAPRLRLPESSLVGCCARRLPNAATPRVECAAAPRAHCSGFSISARLTRLASRARRRSTAASPPTRVNSQPWIGGLSASCRVAHGLRQPPGCWPPVSLCALLAVPLPTEPRAHPELKVTYDVLDERSSSRSAATPHAGLHGAGGGRTRIDARSAPSEAMAADASTPWIGCLLREREERMALRLPTGPARPAREGREPARPAGSVGRALSNLG